MQKLVSRKSNKQPQVYKLQFQMSNMMTMMTMTMMTMTMMMTMLMRLPLTVKILSIEISMKRGFNEGTLGTLRETLDDSEPDADKKLKTY